MASRPWGVVGVLGIGFGVAAFLPDGVLQLSVGGLGGVRISVFNSLPELKDQGGGSG